MAFLRTFRMIAGANQVLRTSVHAASVRVWSIVAGSGNWSVGGLPEMTVAEGTAFQTSDGSVQNFDICLMGGAGGITVDFVVADGYTIDNRIGGTVWARPVAASTAVAPAADLAITAAAACVTAFAANANRKELFLSNLSASAGPLRYGFTNAVDATHGVELLPGQTVVIDTKTAVYVYSALGCTIARQEIEN